MESVYKVLQIRHILRLAVLRAGAVSHSIVIVLLINAVLILILTEIYHAGLNQLTPA
jgi:hypothetical protein